MGTINISKTRKKTSYTKEYKDSVVRRSEELPKNTLTTFR